MNESGYLFTIDADDRSRHQAAAERGSDDAAHMLGLPLEECEEQGLDPADAERLGRSLGDMARDEVEHSRRRDRQRYLEELYGTWTTWTYSPHDDRERIPMPLPSDWAKTVERFWSERLEWGMSASAGRSR